MALTFYNNKLLRHPQRLSNYLQGKDIVPLTLDIDLTNRCNSNCPACAGFRQSQKEILKLGVIKRLLDDANRIRVKAVVFTGGGEPTLHPGLIELLELASEWGLETLSLIHI